MHGEPVNRNPSTGAPEHLRTLSSQAEKDYLSRTGSSAWERAKPFSHPGADTLADSAQLLHDFSVAMMALAPAPGDLILDLGAGGGWCSDLCSRLHRRTVAVDISLDMLRVARSRQTAPSIPAVAGDLQRLPFRSGSFQKAICLSAIHHVPDMPGAIHEIGRVLSSEGVALFSEPGLGHAEAAVSTAAMRDFGVLEQDVVIADFARACRDAGFRDVRIKTLSYAIPSFDLTPEEFESWSRLAASRRPVRALRKIVLAAMEFLGLGKRGPLFEEAFGMSLVRTLRHAMEDHPIILASKAPLEPASRDAAWRASIEVEAPDHASAGRGIPVRALLRNEGASAWRAASSTGSGHVRLGVQLLDANGHLIARDFYRVDLPADVPPRAAVDLTFTCPAPDAPGTYNVKLDLVAEGVTWFEPTGSGVVTRTVIVTP
jgi:ubiquinone/menaquinone biosynthesis C-methylase UbiE